MDALQFGGGESFEDQLAEIESFLPSKTSTCPIDLSKLQLGMDISDPSIPLKIKAAKLDEFGIIEDACALIANGHKIDELANDIGLCREDLMLIIKRSPIGRMRLRSAKLNKVEDNAMRTVMETSSSTVMVKEQKYAFDAAMSIVKESQNLDAVLDKIDRGSRDTKTVIHNTVVIGREAIPDAPPGLEDVVTIDGEVVTND